MSYWMVAGAVLSAYGSMQAGKAKAAEARAQAAQIEEQKKDAVVQTMQEHNIRLANFQTMQGINDSLGGIMGRDIGSDRSLKAIRERAKREFDESKRRFAWSKSKYSKQLKSKKLTFSAPIIKQEK